MTSSPTLPTERRRRGRTRDLLSTSRIGQRAEPVVERSIEDGGLENIVESPAWIKIDSPATAGISSSSWSEWVSDRRTSVRDRGEVGTG